MRYKKSVIFICLIICLFSIASVCASDVNETAVANEDQMIMESQNIDLLEVENQSDVGATEDNKLSEPAGTFTDLANEISNADGELNLTRDYVYSSSKDDSVYSDGINIDKKLTINGNGFSIYRYSISNIFKISAGGCVLNDIKFIKGYNSRPSYQFSTYYGGAIYWSGDQGILNNCDFINCSIKLSSENSYSNLYSYGGAIYWSGNQGILNNCNFINCTAQAYTIETKSNSNSYGGAICLNGNNIVLEGCIFDACYCWSTSSFDWNEYGGAVYWGGDYGNSINCSFINSHSKCAGAIYWMGNYGNLLQSTFINCYIDSWDDLKGGAIYWKGINGFISNCLFEDCYVISRLNDMVYGGAIYWEGINGFVEYSNFKNCSVRGYDEVFGGAVYWLGDNGSVSYSNFSRCNISSYNENCLNILGNDIYWLGIDGMLYGCFFDNHDLNYENHVDVKNKLNTKLDIVLDNIIINEDLKLIINISSTSAGKINLCQYNLTNNKLIFEKKFISVSSQRMEVPLTKLSSGNYSVIVTYEGDNYYKSTFSELNFTLNIPNISLDIVNELSLNVGNVTIFNITADEDVNGDISILIFNNISTSKLIDGNAIFTIPNQMAGHYKCIINYSGDEKFNSFSIIKFIDINFENSFIKLNNISRNFNEDIILNPIITNGASGEIYFYVDDKYNGKITVGAEYVLSGLTAGNHIIKVVYTGDSYYSGCENISYVQIFKAKMDFSIKKYDSFAGNTKIKIIMDKDNVRGNVTLKFKEKNYTNELISGETTFYISDLVAGIHSFTVDYSGDENYYPTFGKDNVNITVKINNASINISARDVDIDEHLKIEYNITQNISGTLSVYANDAFIKNVTVGDEIELENLKAGNHTIKVVYNSDGYFASCENVTQLEIYKLTPDYYIDDSGAGKNANINLVFDEDATGNVNISFGYWDLDDNNNDVWEANYNFTGQLINGEVNFTIPNLEGGWIEYIIKYSGDDRYDSLNESDYIWVSYKDSPILIDIPEINWSDNVILKPTLPEGATGNIHLLLDNISLANISLGDDFQYKAIKGGKHYLTIEYSGDEYFTSNETTVEFYVNKLNSNFNIESTFDSEKYISIPITLNDDANGFITVNINSNIFSGDVINGSFNFTVTDLGAGAHNAIINYSGDDKYNDIYIAKEITVNLKNSNLNLNITNILKDQNLLIKPELTENATGIIDIYVDDELKRTINVGSSYTLVKPTVGQHKIRLVYSGNTYFDSAEKEFSFRVFTIYPIEAVDTQIVYGTDKKFRAKFYDEYGEILANKYVSFIVNGTEYPIRTNSEGIAVLDVDLGVGEYNITSVSLLDESTTNKLLIFHSIQAESMIIEYGSNTRFKARFLDETANSLKNTRIVFNVDGKDTMVTTDVDGLAILNTEFAMGAHYITSINTITDENMTNKVVIVSDINSIISVEVGDINYGQNASVKVNIDSGYLNADVTIKVTGENGYEQIFTQKAAKTITKEVSGLNASKYRVNVKYADEDLLTIDKNTTFTVSKIDPTITLNVDDTVIGDVATLTINIPQATGVVEIKLGSESYDEQLIDGMIVKELFDFKIGENTIEVFYKGDNNFNPLIKTTAFKAWNNLDLDVAYESEIMVGEDYIIDINNLDENTNEDNLILFIDGVKHNHDFSIMYDDEDTNHIQISFIADLSEGEHIWEITYLDNVNYINTSKSVEFSVIVPPQHDTYQFALITNKSVINIPFDKITWNVKTVSVYDEYLAEYYDNPYVNYTFSTFTLDNIDYVIITSSMEPSFASLAIPFNPKDYNEHDGIYYNAKDGEITEVIGYSDYNVYDNEYYRIVGSGYKTFSENAGAVEYALVNGECYKITGTMSASTAMFNRAIQNVDYKIVNGKYYTLNDELIENLLDESYGSDYAVINGTFYDIDGNIYTPHAIWTIGKVLINNNGELSKVVYGKDYNNSFTIVDGKLYTVVGDAVGEIVDIDMNQSVENQTSENTTDVNETVEPEINIPSLENPSEDGNVAVTLPSDATGTVTLTVNGKDYNFDVKNGIANVKLPELENGNYEYTITYSGDSKYSSFTTNGNMKVNNTKPEDVKPTPEVVIPPLDEPSEDGSVTIILPSDATGKVTLSINGKSYNYLVENGVANIVIPNLGDGNYPYTITYSGDSKYSSFVNNGSLNVNKTSVNPVENQTSDNTTDVNETVEPEIDIPSLDNPSDDGNVTVNLPSDATGTVTLSVGGKDYVFDVKDGVANVKLPELENGNYDYIITYSGDSKYSSFVTNGNMNVNNTKEEDVKPIPEVVIPSLDEPSEDGSVSISLPDDATGTVTLTINGKEYYFAVVKGAANIIIPDLGDGNYPYTITYSGDSKYSSFTTNGTLNKVAPAIDPVIAASNVKVTYATGKYYTIKVYGTDGELADGAKVVITVKAKTFKTLTTTKGVAKFKVTNVPGTYKMNITALGKSVTKTLTVKHLVTLKSVTVKKSAKKLTLQATLGKVNGKYLKNKKITFKFNGKKYTAKTDKKGVAKVTIKSSVLKKLKVGKKVTYQATYGKDTVKKTVKVKK